MSIIPTISQAQKDDLSALHELYGQEACRAGCSTAAASFLLIGALIVITSACLCLSLPGVNAMRDVILPGIVPGSLAIMLSIPLILAAVKYSQGKNFIRRQMIEKMIVLLDKYKIPEATRKVRVKFLLKNFLNWTAHPDAGGNPPDDRGRLIKNISWRDEYQGKILSDIKERLGDEKNLNSRQKKIATAIDKAKAKIPGRK